MDMYYMKKVGSKEIREPETWADFVISIFANMMEEILVLGIIMMAGVYPSYISLFFVLVALPILIKKSAEKDKSLEFSQKYC
jgi:predicted RND superfamily exporter protein